MIDPSIAEGLTEDQAKDKIKDFTQYLKFELLSTETDINTYEKTVTNTTIDLDIEFKDVGRLKTPFVRIDNRALKLRGDPYLNKYDLQPSDESAYVNPVSSSILIRLDHERMMQQI